MRALAQRGLTRDVTAGQAIGYKELLEVLAGAASLEEAVELVKRRTRRYAKRQLSWFRRDGRVRWLDMERLGSEGACEAILSGLVSEEG